MGGLSEPNVVLGFRGLEFRIWGFVEVVRDLGGLYTYCPAYGPCLVSLVSDHAVLQTSLLAFPWASCNHESLVSGSLQ